MTKNNDASSPPQGVGISGAQSAFESYLTGGDNDAGTANPLLDAPDDAEEGSELELAELEADEANSEEDDEGEEQDDPDDETEEEETEEEEDTAGGEALADDAEVTLTIEGKPVKLTGKELTEGYLRTQDYTKKTQALSVEKQSLGQERGQVQQEREVYLKVLPVIIKQLQEQGPTDAEMEALYQDDPVEWTRQNELKRQRRDKTEILKQDQVRAQKAVDDENQRKFVEYVNDENEKLLKAIPEWKDQKKWDADAAKIRKYALGLGFSDEEVDKAFDHRTIQAFRDAAKYRALMSDKPKPKEKVRLRPASPGSQSNTLRPKSGIVKSQERLAKTGKMADATSAFEAILNEEQRVVKRRK